MEEVRVGLLGFRKEVETVRGKVAEREEEVGRVLEERREVRKKIEVGRRLVDYEGRLRVLEERLMVGTAGKKEDNDDSEDSEDDDDDDDDDDGSFGVSIAKLRRHVEQWRLIRQMEKQVGEHPFFASQVLRMTKVRNTLLLDLGSALQQAKSAGSQGMNRVVRIMRIYADMEESAEAVKVLKSLKGK